MSALTKVMGRYRPGKAGIPEGRRLGLQTVCSQLPNHLQNILESSLYLSASTQILWPPPQLALSACQRRMFLKYYPESYPRLSVSA
jgi:hypothetical protein